MDTKPQIPTKLGPSNPLARGVKKTRFANPPPTSLIFFDRADTTRSGRTLKLNHQFGLEILLRRFR
jgi:hypothetical protein